MTAAAAQPGKAGFLKTLPRFVIPALLFVGWEYLRNGKGRLEFVVWPGDWQGMAAASLCLGLGALLAFTDVLDRLPWQGVIRLRIKGGHGWSGPIVSRPPVLLIAGGALWLATAFVGMAFQAFYQGDWARLAVSLLFILGVGWVFLPMLLSAFSARPILVVDAEGLYCAYGDIPWSHIEKIGAGHDPADRNVYLYLNTGAALGPARRLSVGDAGISVSEFLARVQELAPQVIVEQAEPRAALFASFMPER